ncbi:MAG: Gfo/Idh/MocA family oxidoreductase [Clostridia bacterium]|nr:Gfo/Idh/MocA family oxidoreductase [Clostridia bacterium]
MKKIRFGIVGTGTIAHRFARAIRNTRGAELAAVASRTKEGAEAFSREFEIPLSFTGYESMAQSDRIDAAYIAVPHSGHITCSMLMMNHGKHVLCEKPMAVNAREAEMMFECAGKNNVLLTEAMWARLVPGTVKMLELVSQGVLGDILGVEGKFCYTMDEDEMDHHVFKPENGGGSLLDVGCYGLNFASWYLGDEIEHISAEADFYNGTDCHTCVLLKYKSGAIADISSATLLRKPNEGYIYGTKGYARLGRFYAPQEIILNTGGVEECIQAPYAGNGFEEQIEHFCECIGQGLRESPVITHAHTLGIITLTDRIREIISLKYPQDDIR